MKECVYCGKEIDGNGIYFCSKCKKKIKDLGYINTGNVMSDWTAQAYWYLEENGGNYWKDYRTGMPEEEYNKQFVRPIDYIRFETYRDCIGADPKKFAMSAKHMNEMEKWYLELAEKYGKDQNGKNDM